MRLRILAGAVVLIGTTWALSAAPAAKTASVAGPRYDAGGKLMRPTGVMKWVAVGSSVGLGYSEGEPQGGPGPLRTVLLEPSAYAAFTETGEFPDGTMLALAVYEPQSRASIAKQGYFQGDLARMEIALKDSSRFEDTWAYFDFGKPGAWIESATPFAKERCWSCHRAAGEKDNVFVQFYPVLRGGATLE